jgi:hypothetical protein
MIGGDRAQNKARNIMCGNEPAEDIVARIAHHAGTTNTSPQNSIRRALAHGEAIQSDTFYDYMDELFHDAVAFALADIANARAQDRDNIVRSQSIVLARVAGLLAAQLGGRDDLIGVVMGALLDGYAAKAETPSPNP